jgi:hypothetical protein
LVPLVCNVNERSAADGWIAFFMVKAFMNPFYPAIKTARRKRACVT